VKIGRVGIVAHGGKEASVRIGREISDLLAARDVVVSSEDPDIVLSLGGDGTMLRAARLAHLADAPLLGINLGTLGFLTEVDADDVASAIERVFAGEYQVERRMMLECTSSDDGDTCVGLNEILVERSSEHRLVRLEVAINGEGLAAFNADGVIVATPTGSTAYALSAGGPIVSPGAQCLVLVPVSAHMIFSRPFVLSADDVVEVRVDPTAGRRASLSVDGADGWELPPGAVVSVRRHRRDLQLVRLSGPRFLERLRVKLGLPS